MLYEGRRETILSSLHELTGHDLACWCPLDEPCHADTLLALANTEPRRHHGMLAMRKTRVG
jgi:hypothetical protein